MVSGGSTFADAMFLLNVLVMLQFNLRTEAYSYVWVILPIALFLSGVLMGKITAWYVAAFGLATFMFNSTNGVKIYGPESLPLFQEPFEIIGSVILMVLLILICLRPTRIFKSIQIERL